MYIPGTLWLSPHVDHGQPPPPSQERFRQHNRYGIWNTYCTYCRQVDQASDMGHCWAGIQGDGSWWSGSTCRIGY